MNRSAPARRWLMPWLAPIVLTALYVVELRQEGVAEDPGGLLAQLVLAAPLVVAGSVLLAVVEQEVRAGALTPLLRRWLVWTPRVLLLIFVAFLALLSLDVFVEGRSVGEIALGLLVHNLPAIGLLAVAVVAWRWPWVGALGLLSFAGWWLTFFQAGRFVSSVFLLMAVLPLAVAALFLLSWWLGAPAHVVGGPRQAGLGA